MEIERQRWWRDRDRGEIETEMVERQRDGGQRETEREKQSYRLTKREAEKGQPEMQGGREHRGGRDTWTKANGKLRKPAKGRRGSWIGEEWERWARRAEAWEATGNSERKQTSCGGHGKDRGQGTVQQRRGGAGPAWPAGERAETPWPRLPGHMAPDFLKAQER